MKISAICGKLIRYQSKTVVSLNTAVAAMHSHIKFKKLSRGKKPTKILVIRLQAAGDFFITLPYLQDLRAKLPKEIQLDILVREEYAEIAGAFNLFNRLHILRGKRNSKKQLCWFLLMWPKLLLRRYDVLMDLQNHRLSRVMRFLLGIRAFSVLDRTSTDYAGDRFKNTINALEIAKCEFTYLHCFKEQNSEPTLKKFGLNKTASARLPRLTNEKYVLLNPAGAFENRNWKLENYIRFCELWLNEIDADAKFIVIGISSIKEKAAFLKKNLGEKLIDLSAKTSFTEAIHIIRNLHFTLSEDSGLMHVSYCLGIPTLAIFGSTRNDWTNPNLPNTFCFNSSDLECGNCMLEKCKFSEVKCLTRIKPEQVILEAKKLLAQKEK